MKLENSYLKKVLVDYPESGSISLSILDNAVSKYKFNKSHRFIAIHIFMLFALFTLVQTLIRFFLSKEVFNLFSNKTSASVSLFKFSIDYIIEYGLLVSIFGLLALSITFYQNRDLLD